MTINSILSFIGSLIVLYLGTKILIKDHRNNLNIMFSLFCLSMLIQTFFAGIAYSLKTGDQAHFITKFSSIGIYTFLPILFHFFLIITRTKIKTWILVLNYLPALFFIFANFLGFTLLSKYIKFRGEWVGIIDVNVYSFYLLHIIIFLSIGLILIYKWGKRTDSNKEKIYSKYLLVSSVIMYTTGQTFFFILPAFQIYEYQFIGIITLFLFIYGLYFLVSKFRFLNLNYSILSDEILFNINDSIILLDDKLKIILLNKKTEELIGEKNDKFINKDLSEIVLKYDLIKSEVDKMMKNQYNDFSCRIHFKSNNEPILMDLKFSKVIDKFNDLLGILIIGNEVKELKQLKLFYKLSEREIEIVQLIIEGHSNKEIAANTNLTENTVKSHIMHIFNKLNVNGRVEMINLLTEYNLIPRGSNNKKIILSK